MFTCEELFWLVECERLERYLKDQYDNNDYSDDHSVVIDGETVDFSNEFIVMEV